MVGRFSIPDPDELSLEDWPEGLSRRYIKLVRCDDELAASIPLDASALRNVDAEGISIGSGHRWRSGYGTLVCHFGTVTS